MELTLIFCYHGGAVPCTNVAVYTGPNLVAYEGAVARVPLERLLLSLGHLVIVVEHVVDGDNLGPEFIEENRHWVPPRFLAEALVAVSTRVKRLRDERIGHLWEELDRLIKEDKAR